MKKLFVLSSFFLWFSCAKKEAFVPVLRPSDMERVIQQVTDVMIHDITNPPLAARFFA